MALVVPMAGIPYQRDFDDLGLPSVMADLRERSGYSRPRTTSTLDILSASSYPDPRAVRGIKGQASPPDLALGYVVEETMEGEKTSQANKRSKAAPAKGGSSIKSSSESSSRKQRGRPRLDPKDETAADRRRTQIRLAQRAYRNRKETTISALKNRVSDLQSTIEQMQKSFSLLHDNVVEATRLSPAAPSLTRQLQRTMEEFNQLSRAATDEMEEEEEEVGTLPSTKRDKEMSSPSSKASEDQDSEMQFQFSLQDEDQFEHDSTEGTQMVMTNSFDSSSEVTPSQIAQLENTLINAVGASHWNSASIERPLDTDGAYTYSFQETTFARRLHRQCLERSFRYLSNPELDPTFASRTFRFTFTFSNRKRIVTRLQELLKRKAGESLENWAVPFFPIGGAGTHFPRRDAKGQAIYPPNMLSPATAFGPRLPITGVDNSYPEQTSEKVLEAIGFGGEWFDSHDVEEFLKTKGIYLNAQSSFIGVDSSLVNDGSDSHVSHVSQGSTPAQQLTVDATSLSITEGFGETFGQSNFLSQPENNNISSGWAWNIAEPGAFLSPGTFGSGYALSSRTLTFDVEKFLVTLTEKSACLGRAPGFRRNDVERAIQAALQDTL